MIAFFGEHHLGGLHRMIGIIYYRKLFKWEINLFWIPFPFNYNKRSLLDQRKHIGCGFIQWASLNNPVSWRVCYSLTIGQLNSADKWMSAIKVSICFGTWILPRIDLIAVKESLSIMMLIILLLRVLPWSLGFRNHYWAVSYEQPKMFIIFLLRSLYT